MSDISFSCDWRSGFAPNPQNTTRVGYLTKFTAADGKIATLDADISVYTGFSGTPEYSGISIADSKVTCVGIISSIYTKGGAGDPIDVEVYISGANSTKLLTATANPLANTDISSLDFWVGNFDQEQKKWYDEYHPTEGAVKAMFNSSGGSNGTPKSVACYPDKTGEFISTNSDVKVYKWSFTIVPAANLLTKFTFAPGLSKKSVRPWGLEIASAKTN
jgi:hypothetical protein